MLDVEDEEDPPDDGFAFVLVPESIDGLPYPGMHEGSSGEHVEMTLFPPERLMGELESKSSNENPARATIRIM
jgi:hypothetical protein